MELSPPPSEGAYCGEPSPLRTTISNNAWFLGSPGSASTSPDSPLCQPLKSLHLAASRRTLSGEADAGHLVLRASQVEEVGSQPVEAASQGKRRLAFEGAQELAPSDGSPRIAARHSSSLGGESQRRRSSLGGGLQPAQEHQRASTSSYIEFSLSSASLSQLPAAVPLLEGVPLASNTQHSVQAFPSHSGLPSASAVDSIYRNGRDGWQDDDADLSDLGLPFTGHIIAPAANVRHLWSPSTDPGPATSDPQCSLRSSPCLPSGTMAASASTAASTPDQGQPGGSGSSTAASSPRSWQLDSQSSRWMQQQHPIFELLTEDQHATTDREDSMPAAVPASAAAAVALPTASRAAAACEPLPHVSGSFATPRSQPSSPGALAQPQLASPAQASAAAPAASPNSPGLPPLQHSAWSPVLPGPSSSAAHRRYHSALPEQAVRSSGGPWQGLAGSTGLERAWSVTGSHFDLKFGTPRASVATSVQHGPEAGATPGVDPMSRGPLFSPRRLHAGSAGAAPDAGSPPLASMPSSATEKVSQVVGLPQGTYAVAFQLCKKLDISKARRHVLASPTRRSRVHSRSLMQRLALGCLNPGADQLRWRLGRQRVRLLSLARVPYDVDHPVHYGLMQAVLTGFAGRAAGSEAWKEAGFTSANPSATDLTGCGVLGLLHMLLLLERLPRLAAELQRSAAAAAGGGQAQQQEQWCHDVSPVLLSVHATLWTVHVLRAGLLSRAAKRLKSTTTAAECFYLGAMECLLEQWRDVGSQPQQWHEALHRAEGRAKNNVWPMIQRALSV